MAFFGAGTRSSPIAFVDSEDEVNELYKDLNHSSSSSLSVTLEKPPLPPPPPPKPRVLTESVSISPYVPSIFHFLPPKATNSNPISGTENESVLIVLSVTMVQWLALVCPSKVLPL